MASRSPWAIRAIRTSSEVACVALNGRLAMLVGVRWQEVRWAKEIFSIYPGFRRRSVIYRTRRRFFIARSRGPHETTGREGIIIQKRDTPTRARGTLSRPARQSSCYLVKTDQIPVPILTDSRCLPTVPRYASKPNCRCVTSLVELLGSGSRWPKDTKPKGFAT